MNKYLALAIGAIAATTLTGCIADGGGYAYGGGGGYGRPAYSRGYADDYGDYSYGSQSYGYGGPRYVEEVIYIDGRACRHDHDSDRYYYTSGRDRVYISPEQYSRNRSEINRWKTAQSKKVAEYKYQQNENKLKLDYSRQQQEYKNKQAQYDYSQKQREYQVQQKVASNRAVLDQNKYKADLAQKQREWQYEQKANQLKNQAAINKYRYEHGVRDDDDDKKKKKKN